jgi:WD40 repeat protein
MITLRSACLAIGASLAAVPALANLDHQLNHVWSRLADINGEFGSVESAEFSPDSSMIISGTKYDNSVRAWRTEDGALLWKLALPAEIERVAWTADGQSVVSVSEDRMMRIIDARTGTISREIRHGNGMDSLSLSPDGRFMAVGEEATPLANGTSTAPVTLYDTATWKKVLTVDHTVVANEIDFHPAGGTFVVVGHNLFRLYDAQTGAILAEFDLVKDGRWGPKARFVCAKFSPDGEHIVVGGNHGEVYFFRAKTGKLIRSVNKTGAKIETVEWTKDGKYALASGHASMIDFFNLTHVLNKELEDRSVPIAMRVPLTDPLEYMHFNASGALLTTAHQDGTIQLWTYNRNDPGLNARSHRELLKKQQAQFADQ